jgi:aspartyl-tRNA synthetase
MYRTFTCGELRINDVNKEVILAGWVQRIRNLGAMIFIDLRDRYGITQLYVDVQSNPQLAEEIKNLNREYVIQVTGKVVERANKNPNIPTGDIEIMLNKINILNKSEIPPFTIEDNTDGGDEIRMKYRYLDLRRQCVKLNLELRHKMAIETRNFFASQGFIEVETPILIKSTPEGARDFVVPSRINKGEFYALPQSPQTFKQLLMVAGFDRYVQIVKCFRDEDLRADRQPEFTQIDCEMSFVERDDILDVMEKFIKHLFRIIKNIDFPDPFPRMNYDEALEKYGNDKPDIRFKMTITDVTSILKDSEFKITNEAEYIGAIVADGCSNYSRSQIDELTKFVQKPQIGAKGILYLKHESDNLLKGSIDKYFSPEKLIQLAKTVGSKTGDLILIMAGNKKQTLSALSELRLEMGNRLNLRDKNIFKPLWVIDFPLLEWDENEKRFFAMHHPFTSPKPEDIKYFDSDPAKIKANAYDLVINGVEVGGGSIRIFNSDLQQKMFDALGISKDEAQEKFGFLMNAFRYGAPPHGGIAFGFDRLVAMFAGVESIRDVIAFPKNNAGRDMMIDTPSKISDEQLKELSIKIVE